MIELILIAMALTWKSVTKLYLENLYLNNTYLKWNLTNIFKNSDKLEYIFKWLITKKPVKICLP